MRPILLTAVIFSCGGAQMSNGTGPMVSGQPLSEHAGTRLKHMWHTASDGTVTPAGWYDSTLKTHCEFQGVFGVELCVPDDVYTLTQHQWGDLYSTSNAQ